jgi:hypothetical protein
MYQSMYVSILLPIYIRYIWTGCRRCLTTIGATPENDDQGNSEIHSEAAIEQVWRCTSRWQMSIFGDTLRGLDRVNLEMHSEIVIQLVCRCTWRAWKHQLEGHNCSSSEMHMNTVIGRVWRCTWRPCSSDFRDAFGGCDRVILERHLETMTMKTCRPESTECGREDGGSRWLARQVLRFNS